MSSAETERLPRVAWVVGATGDVGQGIVRALVQDRWQVIAIGRSRDRLDALQHEYGNALQVAAGSVATEADARAVADEAHRLGGAAPLAVIVSVNGTKQSVTLRDVPADTMLDVLRGDLLVHLAAAQTLAPWVQAGGLYLAIGGGMADFVVPGFGHTSVCQAGLRAMMRVLAAEWQDGPVQIKELLIHSMVNGASRRDDARPNWITDDDIGRHILAILGNPAQFVGPILNLRSRKQVGLPEQPRPAA